MRSGRTRERENRKNQVRTEGSNQFLISIGLRGIEKGNMTRSVRLAILRVPKFQNSFINFVRTFFFGFMESGAFSFLNCGQDRNLGDSLLGYVSQTKKGSIFLGIYNFNERTLRYLCEDHHRLSLVVIIKSPEKDCVSHRISLKVFI